MLENVKNNVLMFELLHEYIHDINADAIFSFFESVGNFLKRFII